MANETSQPTLFARKASGLVREFGFFDTFSPWQPLKKRRTRTPDECEMLCGGCGASFDVCDLDTVDLLKRESR